MKKLITVLPQYLEPPRLAEYQKVGGSNSPSHVIVWPRGHVKN